MATALKEKMKELEKRINAMELMLPFGKRVSLSLSKKDLERKRKVLTRTAGALKGKLPKNPVAWQRKIRSEWDRG